MICLLSIPDTPRADAAEICETETVTRFVNGILQTVRVVRCQQSETSEGQQPVGDLPLQSTIGHGTCVIRAHMSGADPDEMCSEQSEPLVTPALVSSAFRNTPLPPSVLEVQPPDGRTLVNFDTNFLTEREPFTRTLTLLGRRIDLRVFAAEFTWRFDDGDPLTTTSPGSRYPDLDVTHSYLRKGTYSPSVDTLATRAGHRHHHRQPGRARSGRGTPDPGLVALNRARRAQPARTGPGPSYGRLVGDSWCGRA
jgi:hypothetical protein